MINLISFNKLKMQKKKFSSRLSKISLYSSFQNSFFYANYLELREHKNTQINSKNLAYYYDLVSFQLFPVILQNMTKHFLLLLLLLSNIIQ
jgi:hypothetical protein